MSPPGSVYFAELVSRFATTCANRPSSPFKRRSYGGKRTSRRWRRCSMSGIAISVPWATTSCSRDESIVDLDVAARDAGDVQKIVDQPDQVLHLPFDDLQGLRIVTVAVQLQDLDGGHDGRQRVAKLVPEHRQELVLGTIGFPQRLDGLLVLRDLLGDEAESRSPMRSFSDVSHVGPQPAVAERHPMLVLELHRSALPSSLLGTSPPRGRPPPGW